MYRRCVYLLGLALLVGCSNTKEDFKDRTPNSIYTKAVQLLNEEEYTEAASEFKDIEMLFPYSSAAKEGQILSAYCFFKAKKYHEAIREIEIFLRYYPSHQLVSYAMYLKAMCLYMQVSNVGRTSENALAAKKVFVELVNKFPNSLYKEDCIKKIMMLDDITAAHEMLVGRYYQNQKNALAAINRYSFVVSQLPHTNFAAEALYRIIECSMVLGLTKEAIEAYQALKHGAPDSKWTKKADALAKNL